MDKKLQEMIADFNKKFSEAQTARSKVIDYLEEEYDIADLSEYDYFEDECDWCFGLDERKINLAIEQCE